MRKKAVAFLVVISLVFMAWLSWCISAHENFYNEVEAFQKQSSKKSAWLAYRKAFLYLRPFLEAGPMEERLLKADADADAGLSDDGLGTHTSILTNLRVVFKFRAPEEIADQALVAELDSLNQEIADILASRHQIGAGDWRAARARFEPLKRRLEEIFREQGVE